MNNTQSKGNALELKCIAKFIELGYECSIPYGNSALYDFVVDIGGKFLRIQCKNSLHSYQSETHSRDTGAFQLFTRRQTVNTKEVKTYIYNSDEIDYFMTMFEDKFYLIPVEECKSCKIIRIHPPKNNIKEYNRAENYLIDNVLLKICQGVEGSSPLT